MSSELHTIYPNFILHKHWDTAPEFNAALAAIARKDAKDYTVVDDSDPRALGNRSNHFGHVRHNMLDDHAETPVVQQLVRMVRKGVQEFLKTAYGYDHKGPIDMIAETFYQQRSGGENVGIFTHTHQKSDMVCTYYPLVDLDEGCENTPLHSGSLRFYDPSGRGNRLWPNKVTGSWHEVQPREGSMVVFEGNIQHDSSYFEGAERICIPVQCDIVTPNRQQKRRF